MEIKDRIQQILDEKQLTSAQFADAIGMQRSTLSHILNGRNKPSIDIISRIHEGCPDVSIEWLLFGEGASSDGEAVSDSSTEPSLFGEPSLNLFSGLENVENGKEMELKAAENGVNASIQGGNAVNEPIAEMRPSVNSAPQGEPEAAKPARAITHITVFYSDNTYETFSPTRKG